MIRATVWTEVVIDEQGNIAPHVAALVPHTRQLRGTPTRLRLGQWQAVEVECETEQQLADAGYLNAVVTRPDGTRLIETVEPKPFVE